MIAFSRDIIAVSDPHEAAGNGLPRRKLREAVSVTLYGNPLCVIHQTFVSDAMSFPRILRWFWRDNWSAKYANAAVLHDYLLKFSLLPKWEADLLFMGALRSSGASALESTIFWLAVRTKRLSR